MEKFVIYLKYFIPSKLPNKKIGFIMGKTIGAIKSLHERVKQKRKKSIEPTESKYT